MERILKKASKTHKHRVEVSHEFRCVKATFTKVNSHELIIVACLSGCYQKVGSHQKRYNKEIVFSLEHNYTAKWESFYISKFSKGDFVFS